MALRVVLNGQEREFPELLPDAALTELLGVLALKSDRVAVELNGGIVPRDQWGSREIEEGDRLEIVHFVGGGAGTRA